MEEEYHIGVASWHNTTTVHPVGLAVVLLLGALLVLLPRRYAILPVVVLVCSIPAAQRFVVFGADFDFLRIMVLFGWIRIIVRGEFRSFVLNRLDILLPAMHVAGTLIYTLQLKEMSAFIYRLGWSFDGVGLYFLFRCILLDWEDLEFIGRAFIFASIPIALAMLLERTTARNVFSVFGGVSELTMVRDGRLRCQGAFMHPILSGCFWATATPLILYQLSRGRIILAMSGLVAATSIVLNSASSTPLMSLVFVFVGMSFFYLRFHMHYIRWGLFATLLLLHAIMKAPVWALLAKVNVFSGSTGYHRYAILDATINNFSKWWLLGEPNPGSWNVWQMRDITNQYILEALRGGLLTLVIFLAIISVAFGMVGKAIRATESDRHQQILVWCIGVCLFVQIVSFFGVSYFGQIIMIWYLNLAMIGGLPTITSQTSPLEDTTEIREGSATAASSHQNPALVPDRFGIKSLR